LARNGSYASTCSQDCRPAPRVQSVMSTVNARRLAALVALAAIVALPWAGIQAARRAAAQDPGVTWLIFVDDLHFDFVNTGHVRPLLRAIASDLIRDGDAFVLRCSGPSPSLPFTTERARLDAAIGRIAGNMLPPDALLRPASSDGSQDERRYRASVAG